VCVLPTTVHDPLKCAGRGRPETTAEGAAGQGYRKRPHPRPRPWAVETVDRVAEAAGRGAGRGGLAVGRPVGQGDHGCTRAQGQGGCGVVGRADGVARFRPRVRPGGADRVTTDRGTGVGQRPQGCPVPAEDSRPWLARAGGNCCGWPAWPRWWLLRHLRRPRRHPPHGHIQIETEGRRCACPDP
jgi:hypothetical protein